MIEQLLQTGRAPFIAVRDGRLHIGADAFDKLEVFIHEIRPVRKLFDGRRLACYSLDCRTGKNGRFCEICPDRSECTRRLQLRLLYIRGERQEPAILELPKHSFRAFDELLQQVGDIRQLPEIMVAVNAVQTATGWTNLEFQKLF